MQCCANKTLADSTILPDTLRERQAQKARQGFYMRPCSLPACRTAQSTEASTAAAHAALHTRAERVIPSSSISLARVNPVHVGWVWGAPDGASWALALLCNGIPAAAHHIKKQQQQHIDEKQRQATAAVAAVAPL